MKVEKINIEGNLKLESVCNYLADIAASLRDGQICVSKNTDFVTLAPSDQLEVSIVAAKKKGKEKLLLKLAWKSELDTPEAPTLFTISSQEPEEETEGEEPAEETCCAKNDEECPAKPSAEVAPELQAEQPSVAPQAQPAAPKKADKKASAKSKTAAK